jgi:hypothetical protein
MSTPIDAGAYKIYEVDETETMDGATRVEKVRCNWGDRKTALPAIGESWGAGSNLVLVERKMHGIGPGELEICNADLVYSTDGIGDALDIESMDTSMQMLPIGTGKLFADGRVNSEPTCIPYYTTDWELERRVTQANWVLKKGVITATENCVNIGTWRGGLEGTWLFCGASARKCYITSGTSIEIAYRVRFKFTYRSVGWNVEWDINKPGGAGWVAWQTPIYPLATFGTVFGF